MHNPLLGPVPNYRWSNQPGYNNLLQGSYPLEDSGTPIYGPVGKHSREGRTDRRAISPPSDLRDGFNSLSIKSPKFDSDSDPEKLHNESLTVTDRGEFILGPQWSVPDPEVAQDIAGCGGERVTVKSKQYSPEHNAYFTLTEKIDDCDVTMSGGLSVGVVPPPDLPGCDDCSLFSSCWSRSQSPNRTDAELPPSRPSSRRGLSRRNGHRSNSEVLVPSSQPNNYEPIPEEDSSKCEGHHKTRNHSHFDQHNNEQDYNYARNSPTEEQQSKTLRRVKNFHWG